MSVPWTAFNFRHSNTALCTMGAECKFKRLANEEAQEGNAVDFKEYSQPFEMISSFRYLAWKLMAVDNDWSEFVSNIR